MNFAGHTLKPSQLACLLLVSGIAALPMQATAQTSVQEQIDRMESQIRELQSKVDQLKKQAGAPSDGVRDPNAGAALADANPSAHGTSASNVQLLPGQIRVGSARLGFGGFVDASTVFRLRNMTASLGTPFTAIPFPSQGDVGRNTEFRGSAQASRFNLAVDDFGTPGGTRLSAFGEIDFLGGGSGTANQIQVNGFQPRLRQAWLAADAGGDSSFLFVAGQAPSLVTPHRGQGVDGVHADLPSVIDDQAVVGTHNVRQWQLRAVKNWGPMSVGVSLENPQTLWANTVTPAGFVRFVTTTEPDSSLGVTPISLDAVPDVALKLSLEKPYGHFELFGLSRMLRLDAGPNGGTLSTNSFAGGVHGRILAAKNLDLTGGVSYGTGLGRYGAAQLPDATSDSLGHPVAVKALHAQAGLVYRPSAKWSLYAYGGIEKAYSAGTGTANGQIFGYGNDARINNGCHGTVTALVTGATFCDGDTQQVSEITVGGWWTLHQSKQGRLQFGSQLAYAKRTLFSDVNGSAPSADNWMLYTSFRYTPFWRE